ncbi:hypothetical protein M404DRAFT_1002617 [Pisolithus tinctorius Marx 270]|uniref:Uncharacterized protein n=1 Tax=Pisolithus tinctorius Marx 270 TaxID=870435 RepID=A0A0C3P4J7_PISTI|nr:hypothetical protein M404DRAFT_1002617 [Pisolithus tinctorius Marx 270]
MHSFFGRGIASADAPTVNFSIPRGIEISYCDSRLQMRTTGQAYPYDYLTHGGTCAGWY